MQLATEEGCLEPDPARASHWLAVCVAALLVRELDLSDFELGCARERLSSRRAGAGAFVAGVTSFLGGEHGRTLQLIILVGWDFFRWARELGRRVVRAYEKDSERRGIMRSRRFYVVKNVRGEW